MGILDSISQVAEVIRIKKADKNKVHQRVLPPPRMEIPQALTCKVVDPLRPIKSTMRAWNHALTFREKSDEPIRLIGDCQTSTGSSQRPVRNWMGESPDQIRDVPKL